MVKKLPELTIFFPFWNEEKNIEKVVRQAVEIAPTIAEKWEIIMIDDGSSDQTLDRARSLSKQNKNLKVISHTPNRGYGASVKEGLVNASYRYIFFSDGDGQFDFSEVEKFVVEIQQADMVIGYRRKRQDHKLFKRLLLMNMLKIWDFVLFGFMFRDIDCGFKMFTKKAIDEILPLRSEGAMITTEILAKAVRKKLKIRQIEVSHFQRKFGAQTGANLPVIFRAVLESLILWSDIHNGRI